MSPHTTPSLQLLQNADPGRTHWLELPAQHASVGVARRSLRGRLTEWSLPDDLRADAILLASELATNAVVHTPSVQILCGVGLITDDCLRLEVHDHDYSGTRLPRYAPGPEDESGRGLLLVEQLAASWGVSRSGLTGGNAVWATLTTADHAVGSRRPASWPCRPRIM